MLNGHLLQNSSALRQLASLAMALRHFAPCRVHPSAQANLTSSIDRIELSSPEAGATVVVSKSRHTVACSTSRRLGALRRLIRAGGIR